MINNLVATTNLSLVKGTWVVRVPEFLKEEKFPSLEKALMWISRHLIPYYGEEVYGSIPDSPLIDIDVDLDEIPF